MLERNKLSRGKSREIDNTGDRIWFTGNEKHRNKIVIIVNKILKENVVETK